MPIRDRQLDAPAEATVDGRVIRPRRRGLHGSASACRRGGAEPARGALPGLRPAGFRSDRDRLRLDLDDEQGDDDGAADDVRGG
jgi:hypothetical protein